MTVVSFDVVIPTSGRASLRDLRDALERSSGARPGRVIVVEDTERRGPAWARNRGWRQSDADWVAFLDDDVVPTETWLADLAGDLAALAPDVAGSQGRIEVPLPPGRRPTDWERHVQGLERARWATADMAYRRSALARVGGFDERFRRAYREDADLALRMLDAGYRIEQGARRTVHPVRPAGRLVSVRMQAGNADDVLMDRLHGPGWRERADAPRGRRNAHLATTAAALAALTGLAARRGRVAALAGSAWGAATAEFAWRRIAPGPRTAGEVATMLATSAVIPPVATVHWLAGHLRRRRAVRPQAVLFDRDGTLVVDVPYNGDPDRVVVMPGAREALDRLREAGVATGVVSNQSGVARGLITEQQLDAVNRRVEELLGPVGPWLVCTHGPDDGCECRKPAPGLIVRAARTLGVHPSRCVLIGDIGSDVEAARAAGARAILVPTAATRREEIEAAPEVAPNLARAVDLVLGGPS